jgi:uncharacterized membrane protein YedE/YeeE
MHRAQQTATVHFTRDVSRCFARDAPSPSRPSTSLAPGLQWEWSMLSSWTYALVGGAMIGAAAALLLLTHGRIAGISGIVGGLLSPTIKDRSWRYAFIAGLLVAGLFAGVLAPAAADGASPALAIAGGLLVGYGARRGSGCTSGHGVCGLSRMSRRSIVAVATFMTTGAITATLLGVFS